MDVKSELNKVTSNRIITNSKTKFSKLMQHQKT